LPQNQYIVKLERKASDFIIKILRRRFFICKTVLIRVEIFLPALHSPSAKRGAFSWQTSNLVGVDFAEGGGGEVLQCV
jgi:hypothetical protein